MFKFRDVLALVVAFPEAQRKIRDLEGAVERLDAQVADLTRKRALVPQDQYLDDGHFVWGTVGKTEGERPFCPRCAAEGKYYPLPREAGHEDTIHCALCGEWLTQSEAIKAWLGPQPKRERAPLVLGTVRTPPWLDE